MRIVLYLFSILILNSNCEQLGLSKKEEDNTTQIAQALLTPRPTSRQSTCTSQGTATTTLDSTGTCVSGITTSVDTTLPSWIKDNFKCATIKVSGTNYTFESKNLPNHKSSYYNTSSSLYEARNTTGQNPNSICSQNFVYTIPSSPSQGTGTVSTQGGLQSIGITTNGLAIFNNAAAPGDLLSTEATTFDNYGGHPQMTGVYHHHSSVPKVSDNNTTTGAGSTNSGNSSLIGIALDGYAIYGKKCDNGTTSTSDDFTPTLDSLHGHTSITTHFASATYHYHYAFDSTATIDTLMGSYFYGKIGSVTNN
jgi:hypothetical protein